jgi:hypothetical protein
MDREVARLIDAYQVGVIDLNDLKQRRDRVADELWRKLGDDEVKKATYRGG